MSKIKNTFNTVNSLDFLLNDILNQIKIVTQDQKDTPYIKLLELFFKGVDLREKLINSDKKEIADPEFKIISGLNNEMV